MTGVKGSRVLIGLLGVAVVVTLSGCPFRRPAPRQQPGRVLERHRDVERGSPLVLGFYTEKGPGEETDSADSLRRNYRLLDEIAFFWYTFDGNGNIRTWGTPRFESLDFAKSRNIKTFALVHNLGPAGFDPALAHSVITRPEARQRFIRGIEKVLEEKGFDGVQVDIEAVPPADRQAYTSFLKELRDGLKGKMISISIPAKTWDDPQNQWSGGFDYGQVHKFVDQVVLMTYDEHGLGTTAGPIASLGWVENVIKYALRNMPRDKVLMGLPVYSFDWSSSKPNLPDYLTFRQVMERRSKYRAKLNWNDRFKVPSFRYTDDQGNNHEVFLENARSASAKLGLVKKYNLHGVAIWRMGMEDPKVWKEVGRLPRG